MGHVLGGVLWSRYAGVAPTGAIGQEFFHGRETQAREESKSRVTERAFAAMMNMKKLDIAQLKAAQKGK